MPSYGSPRRSVAMVLPYSPLKQLAGLEFATVQAAKSLTGSGWTISMHSVGPSGCVDGVAIEGSDGFLTLAWKAAFSSSAIVHFMEIWPNWPTRWLQLAAGIVLRLRGRKVATTVATFGNITARTGSRLEARLWGWINTRIVGLNPQQRDELAALSVPTHTFRVCPRGVPDAFTPPSPSQRAAARTALTLPHDKILILFLGRFVRRKRVIDLAEEWARKPALTRDWLLVFVGSGEGNDDSVEPQLRALVHRNPESMMMRPWTNRPLHYLHACDLFVLPSEREGQPNALLQAMACGLSVIVSPSPGLTHIVENGSTGLHAQSLEDVLDAIARLATHAEFRQRLGANAARYVTGAHTMRDVRRFHKGLYEEMSGPQS